MSKFLLIFLFPLNFVFSFQVNLTDENPTFIKAGDITRVDVVLTNPSTDSIVVTSKIDSDQFIVPIINGQTFTINSRSQDVLSFYLSVNKKIPVGTHEVTFRFYNSSYNYYVKKELIVKEKETISWWSPLFKLFL